MSGKGLILPRAGNYAAWETFDKVIRPKIADVLAVSMRTQG
jgi:hypothetical protein